MDRRAFLRRLGFQWHRGNPVPDCLLRYWQAWVDFRCGLFGHTLSEASGYCHVCRRFQYDHMIRMSVRALTARIDREAMHYALSMLAEQQQSMIGDPIKIKL